MTQKEREPGDGVTSHGSDVWLETGLFYLYTLKAAGQPVRIAMPMDLPLSALLGPAVGSKGWVECRMQQWEDPAQEQDAIGAYVVAGLLLGMALVAAAVGGGWLL